jgi:LemA protein
MLELKKHQRLNSKSMHPKDKPNNYRLAAWLVFLLVSLPIGIFALYHSYKTDKLYLRQEYTGAGIASKRTLLFIRGTLLVTALLYMYIFFQLSYNSITSMEEETKRTWNNLESAYQQRNGLLVQLENTVKGVADFEQKTLIDVIEARTKATSMKLNAVNLTPENRAKFHQTQEQLKGSLSHLLVVAEQYPQLKANENFTTLQGQLESIENSIDACRHTFNEAVQDYNVKVRSFPGSFIAGIFGFKQKRRF